MDADQTPLRIVGGTDVYGSDGEKVGSVDRVQGDYVVVSKGFFFPSDYYVPTSAIADANDDGVTLNVTKDQALNQGWDNEPAAAGSTDTFGTTGAAGFDQPNTTPDATLQQTGDTRPFEQGVDTADTEQPFEHRSDTERSHTDDAGTMRVPLSEEELTAERRSVDRGSVRVEKNVVEEEQSLDVPVTEERVNVTRRTVDRDVAPEDATFEGDSIDIPVRGEEVDVQKRARVREELDISKEAVEGSERVTGTVRREEADVVDDSKSVVDDDTRSGDRKNRT